MFEGVVEGNPHVFDAAMATQAAVNQQKTLSKVSIARPIVKLVLKGNPESIKLLEQVKHDVFAATKTETSGASFVADPAFEKNVFQVVEIEYGPDAKAGG